MNIEQLKKMTDEGVIKNFYLSYGNRIGRKASIRVLLNDGSSYEVENDILDVALNKISTLIN